MFYFIYNFIWWLVLLVIVPFYAIYLVIWAKDTSGLKQRLGILDKSLFAGDEKETIWFHAASVGEIQVVRAILQELGPFVRDYRVFVTTTTEQGNAVAEKQLDAGITCLIAPLDMVWLTRRFLKLIKPQLFICLETELWPNMLREAKRYGANVVLLNGRLSEKSFQRYRLIQVFMASLLQNFDKIITIHQDDAARFHALGAYKEIIDVAGNAKYALGLGDTESLTRKNGEVLVKKLNFTSKTIFVAGSTHTGEEEMLLGIFPELKKIFPHLVLVIAPRHLFRLAQVCSLLDKHQASFQLLSRLHKNDALPDVIVVDEMGVLTSFYAAADYVFCGGSLVNRGGHNIMEPALYGKPAIYGPFMADFRDAKEMLEKNGAAFPISSAREIITLLTKFSKTPAQYQTAGIAAQNTAYGQLEAVKKQGKIFKDILS